MMDPVRFLRILQDHNIRLFAGVPCSHLSPLMNAVQASGDARYVNSTNEGDAVATACGAELGGAASAVLFQNSGLGNAINPLTSLAITFRIPILVISSWRGNPNAEPDEPQHRLMGQMTPELFRLMGMGGEIVSGSDAAIAATLQHALTTMRKTSAPFALIVPKGALSAFPMPSVPGHVSVRVDEKHCPSQPLPAFDCDDVIRAVHSASLPDSILLATTGFTGRVLYGMGDRPNQLYMVGSMGCASSLGLGVAIAQPDRRVIVLDGDGALLMRSGALATIGLEEPANLIHIVLDNGVHDSTGAQPTASSVVDFAMAAQAFGYPCVKHVASLEQMQEALRQPASGPSFFHVRTKPRRDRKLPRPSITPDQVAGRLREWIQKH